MERCDRQIARESDRCEDDQTKVGLSELAVCGGRLIEVGRVKTPKGIIVEFKCERCLKPKSVIQ